MIWTKLTVTHYPHLTSYWLGRGGRRSDCFSDWVMRAAIGWDPDSWPMRGEQGSWRSRNRDNTAIIACHKPFPAQVKSNFPLAHNKHRQETPKRFWQKLRTWFYRQNFDRIKKVNRQFHKSKTHLECDEKVERDLKQLRCCYIYIEIVGQYWQCSCWKIS